MHASTFLIGSVQKVEMFFREPYLRMDMWKEQMSQTHGHDIQSRLNLIGATRWWSKHECLRKIFGTFEDRSSGMFCDVIEILHCAFTSEKLSVKARFDANVLLDNMIQYQHVLATIPYRRIMEITTALSTYVQTSRLDFINAFNAVKATKKDIQQIHRNFAMVVTKTDYLFNMPMKFWKNVDVMSLLKATFLVNGLEKVKMNPWMNVF